MAMRFSVRWQSQRGNRTRENRDRAGIGIVGDAILAVVADGSTTGKHSGELAQCLVRDLIDWFVGTDGMIGERELSGQLHQIHSLLAGNFPRSSASYMILITRPQSLCLVAYAGDCILGSLIDDKAISWLTAPDTLANALLDMPIHELAKTRSRHLLTRSFRSREFMPPSFRTFKHKETRLLVATDGFWADLSLDAQLEFLAGNIPPEAREHDDRSVLELASGNHFSIAMEQVEVSGDVYIRLST